MFDFVVQRHLSSDLSLEVLSSFPLVIVNLCWGLQSNSHPSASGDFWASREVPHFRVSMLTFFHPSLSDLSFLPYLFWLLFQHKTVFSFQQQKFLFELALPYFQKTAGQLASLPLVDPSPVLQYLRHKKYITLILSSAYIFRLQLPSSYV